MVKLFVPDSEGNVADVVLGFDTPDEYTASGTFFGATVGRNANRIGGAAFPLNGKTVSVPVNEGSNNLHSGPDFFHLRLRDLPIELSHLVAGKQFAVLVGKIRGRFLDFLHQAGNARHLGVQALGGQEEDGEIGGEGHADVLFRNLYHILFILDFICICQV